MNHFVTDHSPDSDGKNLAEISPSFLVESFITSEEENWMGIPGCVIKEWRSEYEIPDTDDIEEILDTNKRAQAESEVSTQPPLKRTACVGDSS